MKFLLRATVAAVTVAVVFASPRIPSRRADRIFVNGKIWTGDDANPVAQAIAIAGDRLLVVGTDSDARALAGPDTAVVDLGGRLVVPGFQDSHLHFPGGSVNEVDLSNIETLEEFQRALADFAREHPSLQWIEGHGWGYAAFPNQTVDKRYIDAVIADRPVYLTERDGHMGFGNSKALQIANITADTPDPPNGQIVKGPDGQPTGELKEAAQRLVARHIPPLSEEDRYAALLQRMDEAAAAGITSVQDASTSLDVFPVFERAAAAGALKLRFRFATPILPAEGLSPREHHMRAPLTSADLAPYRRLRETFRGPLLKFGAIKGMLDGTVDARTAAMFEPYVGGGSGIPFWEQGDLNAVVALYDKEGFQVLLHAIGDKAIAMALDAFEYAAKTNGTSGRRHRIEHAEVPRRSDLPRWRRLGVIASTQPMFANPDATVLENFAVLLGPERASRADSFRIYDTAEIVQAFGSDWSVFPFEPLRGIHVAVTRTTPKGAPPGGWYPDGRISVEAALRHYTRDGAYASFDEEGRGTLTAGKLADLVVLSKNILALPPDEILTTRVLRTVMGGKDTYRAPD